MDFLWNSYWKSPKISFSATNRLTKIAIGTILGKFDQNWSFLAFNLSPLHMSLEVTVTIYVQFQEINSKIYKIWPRKVCFF